MCKWCTVRERERERGNRIQCKLQEVQFRRLPHTQCLNPHACRTYSRSPTVVWYEEKRFDSKLILQNYRSVCMRFPLSKFTWWRDSRLKQQLIELLPNKTNVKCQYFSGRITSGITTYRPVKAVKPLLKHFSIPVILKLPGSTRTNADTPSYFQVFILILINTSVLFWWDSLFSRFER